MSGRTLQNLTFTATLSGSIEYFKLNLTGELAEIIAACDAAGHLVLEDGDCKCGWVGALAHTTS